VPPTSGATSSHVYFNCGRTSHFAHDCTTLKKKNTQGHQKVAIAKTSHVNYTTMVDIPEGEQVLAGMFSLNEYPVVILFDSSATYDFISKTCTQQCHLVIEHMHTPYMVSTPGGKKFTKQVVVNPSLNLKGRLYKTCLIVLGEQGIDVILEMNWMKRHKTLLDTAA
jgi:hypothetical protein